MRVRTELRVRVRRLTIPRHAGFLYARGFLAPIFGP